MKVVCLGGGTGLSQLLTALKKIKKIKRLSAIVTVTDSGGSTGILRKIYDIPAIGDIRNCLIALSDIENYLKKAFQYRFKGKGLQNHPLGNLFLVALIETQGNLEKAIKIASKVLKIKGEIIPSSLANVHLGAKFENGVRIIGEEKIPLYKLKTKKKIDSLFLYPYSPKATNLALKRIKEANFIFIGPGSLYTSILPNFLVKGISEAVNKSSAQKIFIMNILTQPGETDNFSASKHLEEFFRFSKINKIDLVLLNNQKPSQMQEKRMREEGKQMVQNDLEKITKLGVKYLLRNLINPKDIYVKHSPQKLKKAVEQIINLTTKK